MARLAVSYVVFTPVGPRLPLHQGLRGLTRPMAGLCPSFWVSREGAWEKGFLLSDEGALVWPAAAPDCSQSMNTPPPPESLAPLSLFRLDRPGGFDLTLLWIFLPTIRVYTAIVFQDQDRQTIDLDVSLNELFPLAH